MKKIFYRQNKKFCINVQMLKPEARKASICNALYADVYREFLGACENPKYKKLTPLEKFNKLNEYAYNWLKDRGLE